MSFTFKETEEKIKKYYDGLKTIERLKHKLQIYIRRKEDIERKIENSVIKLEDNFMAVSYGGVSGTAGTKTSPQEKAVDTAFMILERNLEEVKGEILLIEEEINSIEADNADMEYILNSMGLEYINILESLYKYNKGTLITSMNYSMDKSTVSRKKDRVIKEVMRWLNFYN